MYKEKDFRDSRDIEERIYDLIKKEDVNTTKEMSWNISYTLENCGFNRKYPLSISELFIDYMKKIERGELIEKVEESLDLCVNDSYKSIECLFESMNKIFEQLDNCNIESMKIIKSQFKDKDIAIESCDNDLFKNWVKLWKLKDLVISGISKFEFFIEGILNALKNYNTIKRLLMHKTKLSDYCLYRSIKLLHEIKLEELVLVDCNINYTGATIIFSYLKENKTIKKFNISNNKIFETTDNIYYTMNRKETMQEIKIKETKLMELLAYNDSIEELDLSATDPMYGCCVLTTLENNNKIKKLNISWWDNCVLCDYHVMQDVLSMLRDTKKLKELIMDNSILKGHMDYNHDLINIICGMKYLKHLSMKKTEMNEKTTRLLMIALSRKTKIERLGIYGNHIRRNGFNTLFIILDEWKCLTDIGIRDDKNSIGDFLSCYHKEDKKRIIDLFSNRLIWNPNTHNQFPKWFRQMVYTIVLSLKHLSVNMKQPFLKTKWFRNLIINLVYRLNYNLSIDQQSINNTFNNTNNNDTSNYENNYPTKSLITNFQKKHERSSNDNQKNKKKLKKTKKN
jgi:hypothetical protein